MIPDYYLVNPTGNITILADMPSDSGESLPLIADKLMELEPSAEQVGFLSAGDEECDISLTMAGGEFCGNAALSAAAVFCSDKEYIIGEDINAAERRTLTAGTASELKVRVSGAPSPVSVEIRRISDSLYEGTVEMPQALSVSERELEIDGRRYRFPVVAFPGIMHVICERRLEEEFASVAVKKWCSDLDADALGIMQLDRKNSSMIPLVYVKKAGTVFYESSCASGTAAVGAFLAAEAGQTADERFSEPAGYLKVRAEPDGRVFLTGTAEIIKKAAK